MAINLDKVFNAPSNTEQLVKIWFNYKYCISSCEDEALDWSQHDLNLDIKELEEFIIWRDNLIKAKKAVSACIPSVMIDKFPTIYDLI